MSVPSATGTPGGVERLAGSPAAPAAPPQLLDVGIALARTASAYAGRAVPGERLARQESRPRRADRKGRPRRTPACPPGTRRCPSSGCRRPGGSPSPRGSARRSGSSTPCASAVAPPATASFASASFGAWTVARRPARRGLVDQGASATSGVHPRKARQRIAAPRHVVEHQLDLGGRRAPSPRARTRAPPRAWPGKRFEVGVRRPRPGPTSPPSP